MSTPQIAGLVVYGIGIIWVYRLGIKHKYGWAETGTGSGELEKIPYLLGSLLSVALIYRYERAKRRASGTSGNR